MKSCELPEDELEGRMLLAGITKGSDVFLSPLLDTVTKAPHVFNDGVLSKLDTVDLMMLSRVNLFIYMHLLATTAYAVVVTDLSMLAS